MTEDNWTYRGVINKDGGCSIRQVFYDTDGTMISFSIEPVPPIGETEDDLVSDLAMMLEGLQQPFLLEGDFVPDGDSKLEFTFIREDENKYH